ncbi:MAG: hypothetical protein AAF597_04140, partial [Bacteroidota bacterium]
DDFWRLLLSSGFTAKFCRSYGYAFNLSVCQIIKSPRQNFNFDDRGNYNPPFLPLWCLQFVAPGSLISIFTAFISPTNGPTTARCCPA